MARSQALPRRFLSISFLKRIAFSNLQIADLVSSEFGVEFRMMEKVEVKGSNVHPVWRYLTGDLFFTEISNSEYFLQKDIFHLSLKTVFLFEKRITNTLT